MQLDLELLQIDAKIDFLYGDLKEDIYITQLDGFKIARKENIIHSLKKSMYDFRQLRDSGKRSLVKKN